MQGLLPLSRVGTVAMASFLRQHHYVTAVLWVPQVRGTLWIASWKQSGVWLGCSLAEPWACGHCGLLPLLRLLRSSIPKEGVCWGFSLTVPPAGFPGSKRLGSRLSLFILSSQVSEGLLYLPCRIQLSYFEHYLEFVIHLSFWFSMEDKETLKNSVQHSSWKCFSVA